MLRQLRQGVYEAPRLTKFGVAPVADEELVRAYLGTDDFLFTGSERWNALGLGATGVQAVTLIYNKKRSEDVTFGKRRFQFRRVAYPSTAPRPECFALDLLRHCGEAGVSREDVLVALVTAIGQGRFDGATLLDLAKRFARSGTVALVAAALAGKIAAAPQQIGYVDFHSCPPELPMISSRVPPILTNPGDRLHVERESGRQLI